MERLWEDAEDVGELQVAVGGGGGTSGLGSAVGDRLLGTFVLVIFGDDGRDGAARLLAGGHREGLACRKCAVE